jgi:hypothetical protein
MELLRGEKILSAIDQALSPDNRTMAIAPVPGAVDMAAIVSTKIMGLSVRSMASALYLGLRHGKLSGMSSRCALLHLSVRTNATRADQTN